MKHILILTLALLVLSAPVQAEDKKDSLSGSGRGGMTYSPTEGWIKTGSGQMKVGTDSMEFFKKKKMEEDAQKQRAEFEAKKKADEEAAVKLKAEQDAKLAKADAIIKANEEAKATKEKTKQKARRVLVS